MNITKIFEKVKNYPINIYVFLFFNSNFFYKLKYSKNFK